MSITQEFVYETDSLDSLKIILNCILPIMFNDKVHLKSDAPLGFHDGRDYTAFFHKLQRIVEGTDGSCCLVAPDRTYNGVPVDRVDHIFHNLGEAAAASHKNHLQIPSPTPKRIWISTLVDCPQEVKAGDIRCKSYEDALNKILVKLKSVSIKQLSEKCGDGYSNYFNRDDGNIVLGYRLQCRTIGGWNNLDVSAVHIYYGK